MYIKASVTFIFAVNKRQKVSETESFITCAWLNAESQKFFFSFLFLKGVLETVRELAEVFRLPRPPDLNGRRSTRWSVTWPGTRKCDWASKWLVESPSDRWRAIIWLLDFCNTWLPDTHFDQLHWWGTHLHILRSSWIFAADRLHVSSTESIRSI